MNDEPKTPARLLLEPRLEAPHLPTVHVVILDWGTPELTMRAVRSAVSSRGVTAVVTLVDNGCPTDHSPLFRGAFPSTTVAVYRNRQNLGFAGGMNAVLRSMDTSGLDGIALLNSDSVLDPDALATLIAEFRDPQVGGVAPAVWLTTGNDEELEGLGGAIDWVRGRPTVAHKGIRRHQSPLPTSFDADWLSGVCLLMRPDAVRDVGLFDPRYFVYFEETDWCVRASRRGWRLRNCPGAAVSHIGAASSGCTTKLYWLLRNNVLFMRKLAPRRFLAPFLAYWWCVQTPNLARWCLSEPVATASAISRAVLWHVRRIGPVDAS